MAKAKSSSPYGAVKFKTIDEYHASFPPALRTKLDQMRQAIREAAPGATETISYNIPTFRGNKNLVHYAAFKEHIGFYPTTSVFEMFKKELEKFKTSKGTVQFPHSEPLPIGLIKKIVKFRVTQI